MPIISKIIKYVNRFDMEIRYINEMFALFFRLVKNKPSGHHLTNARFYDIITKKEGGS